MSFQLVFNFLRIGITFVFCLVLLPFLCLIELYHCIFTGRFRSFQGKTVLVSKTLYKKKYQVIKKSRYIIILIKIIFKVTGAGNGLGRELARQLAQQNCTVLCVDMKQYDVNETVKAIEEEKKGKGFKMILARICWSTLSLLFSLIYLP